MTAHTERMSQPKVSQFGSLLCAGNTSVSAATNSARLGTNWRGFTFGISVCISHTPNVFASRDRPAGVPSMSDTAENAFVTLATQASDPPTSVSANAAPTTSSYPRISSSAWMGADDATAACTRWGYLSLSHDAIMPG